LLAILLLMIYLFNLCGYSLVFRYLIQQSEQQLTQQLDLNNYQENELVQISIPLHLPYMQNSSGFERIEGSIEHNGNQYNYVKRMLRNDTLYILCLPNHQKTQLVKGKASFAGQANDFAGPKKDNNSSAKKVSLSGDYQHIIAQYSFLLPVTSPTTRNAVPSCTLHSATIDTPGHPPKASC